MPFLFFTIMVYKHGAPSKNVVLCFQNNGHKTFSRKNDLTQTSSSLNRGEGDSFLAKCWFFFGV